MTTVINGTSTSASAPAVVGDDSNSGVYFPTSDQVAIATNGTQAVLIDSSQNVGVGSTPSAWGGYKGIQLPAGSAIVGNTSSNSMILAANLYSTSGGAGWNYVTSTGGCLGVFETNFFKVYTAPSGTAGASASITNVATINANGIGVGTATPSSGTGITFPASQSASSDANTLDDYEEGTFSPTLVAGSVNFGSVSYAAQSSSYTKVGRLVTFQIYLQVSAVTKGSASGNVIISNLPFTNNANSPTAVATAYNANGWTTVPSKAYIESGGTFMYLGYTNNANSTWNFLDVAGVSTGANYIMVAGSYFTS